MRRNATSGRVTRSAGVPLRRVAAAALALLAAPGCASGTKTSTGRTERETDSVIAQSQVPGAPVVKKAMAASDSARARIAAQDSIAAGQ